MTDKDKTRRPQLRESVLVDLPLSKYLTIKSFEVGLNNTELAAAIGYERANVVAMIKGGTMKLPVQKVPVTARALGVDPVFLLKKVMMDSTPEVWGALEEVMGAQLLTRNERKLIEVVRTATNNGDIDFTEHKEFLSGLQADLEKVAVAVQKDQDGLAQIAAKTSPTELAKMKKDDKASKAK